MVWVMVIYDTSAAKQEWLVIVKSLEDFNVVPCYAKISKTDAPGRPGKPFSPGGPGGPRKFPGSPLAPETNNHKYIVRKVACSHTMLYSTNFISSNSTDESEMNPHRSYFSLSTLSLSGFHLSCWNINQLCAITLLWWHLPLPGEELIEKTQSIVWR